MVLVPRTPKSYLLGPRGPPSLTLLPPNREMVSFGLSILVPIPGKPGPGTRRARVARLRREPQGIISAAAEPQGFEKRRKVLETLPLSPLNPLFKKLGPLITPK